MVNLVYVFQELLFSSPAMTSEPHLSESELAALRTIYKATVEQARRWGPISSTSIFRTTGSAS